MRSMRMMRIVIVAAAPLVLGGCLARAAVDVVSVPVHAAGKVVDWSTTSQDEADRNRGRMERKEDARRERERRKLERERRKADREAREDRRDD